MRNNLLISYRCSAYNILYSLVRFQLGVPVLISIHIRSHLELSQMEIRFVQSISLRIRHEVNRSVVD